MKHKSQIIVIAILSILLVSFTFSLYFKSKDNTKDTNGNVPCDLYYDLGTIYLAVGEVKEVDHLSISEDTSIVSVNNLQIKGMKAGETYVKFAGCQRIKVCVSDLYSPAFLDNQKEFLPCGYYSLEENNELDEALKGRIYEVGYHTRAGVVEAMRFLFLNFNYRLNYFFENGRLENDYQEYVDGEGRYYKLGLYLDESRYENIFASETGPSTWGCDLYAYELDEETPNGFDCSGLICWALLNGGYDSLDIGSGPSYGTYDLTDLGKKVLVENLSYNQLKVGDLVGFDGHVAMIIGINNDNFYIAETYWDNDMYIREYDFEEFVNSEWEYVMLMDNYYLSDGDLDNMW